MTQTFSTVDLKSTATFQWILDRKAADKASFPPHGEAALRPREVSSRPTPPRALTLPADFHTIPECVVANRISNWKLAFAIVGCSCHMT
jgi:hypothetical protein